MTKYLVLYHSEAALSGMGAAEMFANTPPEQMAAGMGLWMAWHAKHGAAIKDMGAPLDHSTVIAGGSATPTKSTITGFSVVEAASMEEAAGIMKGHPHFHAPGASVQILEFVKMPGM